MPERVRYQWLIITLTVPQSFYFTPRAMHFFVFIYLFLFEKLKKNHKIQRRGEDGFYNNVFYIREHQSILAVSQETQKMFKRYYFLVTIRFVNWILN